LKLSKRLGPGFAWMLGQALLATAVAVVLGLCAGAENYLFIGALLGAAAVALSSFDWRRFLVPAIFVFVCAEGFITLYTGQAKLSYLLKDFLVIVAYLSLLTEIVTRQKLVVYRGVFVPMAVLAAVGLVEVFNPNLADPRLAGDNALLVGTVGFKILCFYMPLVLVGYYCFEGPEALRRFLLFLAVLSVPVSVVALQQYVGGAAEVERWGGGFERAVVHTPGSEHGEHLRAIGTFSSPAMLALYCLCVVVVCTAGLRLGGSTTTRTVLWGCLLCAVAALFASGTRGGMIATAAIVGSILILRGRAKGLAAGAAVALLGLGVTVLLGEAVLGRVGSLLEPGTWAGRLKMSFGQAAKVLERAPLGYGLGCASVGARHVMPSGQPIYFVETYITKLAYETGVLGILAYFWLIGAAALHALQGWRRTADPRGRWLALCLGVMVPGMMFLSLFSVALDVNPVNVYLWFLLGVMLRIPELSWDPAPAPAPAAPPGPGSAPAAVPLRGPR